MQFQVPQFIETEDKLMWSLTLKQFLYLAAAAGTIFFLFFYLEPWLCLLIAPFIIAIGAAFAFLHVNGRPFIALVKAAVHYIWHPHVYVFKPTIKQEPEDAVVPDYSPHRNVPTPTFGGLKSLLDKITTSKEAISRREQPLMPQLKATQSQEKIKERYELVRNITGDRETARRVDYR